MDILVDVEGAEGGDSESSIEVVVGDLAVSACAALSIGGASSEVAPAPEAETSTRLSAAGE